MLRSPSFAYDAAKTATAAGVKRLALAYLVVGDDPDFDERDWKNAVNGYWNGPFFVDHDGIKISLS